MRNRAYDLSVYVFSAGEQIFVDANIWLYLFPAPTNSHIGRCSRTYSCAFSQLISQGAQPILDPMVLSEYLNRYTRIEWGPFRIKYPDFKTFRKSPDFRAVGDSAKIFARKIIDCCTIDSVPANQLDLNRTLSDFSSGQIDFNDALFVGICQKKGFKLLTHDGDFLDGGIEVLTANQRLLQACPYTGTF